MELLLLVWFLCGIVTAMIMNSKTDSHAKIAFYFVLGLLLGFLGILLALVAPNEKSVQAVATVSVSQEACPYCRETIMAGAIKCKHCGERLDRTAVAH